MLLSRRCVGVCWRVYTGVKRWQYKTGGIVITTPALGPDSVVVVGSMDGAVYAINGSTGRAVAGGVLVPPAHSAFRSRMSAVV